MSVVSLASGEIVLNGVKIVARESDGYVHATALCKAAGKTLSHWLELDHTKSLVTTLAEQLGRKRDNEDYPYGLISTTRGKNASSFIHHELVGSLAQWLSPEFALMVNRWIHELLHEGHVSLEVDLRRQLEDANKASESIRAAFSIAQQRCFVMLRKPPSKVKPEYIYIASSAAYSSTGLYKIGRSTNLKARISSQNTGRAPGDKLAMLHYWEVDEAVAIESLIKTRLADIRSDNKSEFVLCPFVRLCALIENIIDANAQLRAESDADIGEMISECVTNTDADYWNHGVDPSLFEVAEDPAIINFNSRTASKSEYDAYIDACFQIYYDSCGGGEDEPIEVRWSEMRDILKDNLPAYKSDFLALEWRKRMKERIQENGGYMIVDLQRVGNSETTIGRLVPCNLLIAGKPTHGIQTYKRLNYI